MYQFAPLIVALTLSPIPVGAASGPASQSPNAEKPVCKRTMRTGTRFVTKTCRTQAQWEEIAEANRRAAKEMADRPAIAICGPQTGCE